MGVVLPQVLAAADRLVDLRIAREVVCLTSADLVFRAFQVRKGLRDGDSGILDVLFAEDRAAPIVTVHDGHPHTLTFLGTINGVPTTSLGIDDFGQTGDVSDLYRHFGIDVDTIVGAALDLIE